MENPENLSEEELQQKMAENSLKKERALFKKLVIKLEPHVTGAEAGFMQLLKQEVEDKIEAPGGPALLEIIGEVYVRMAKQHMGRFLGIEGFFSGIAQKGHNVGLIWDAAKATINLALEIKNMQEGNVHELSEQDQQKFANLGLNAFWLFGKIEIEKVVSQTCESVLTELGVPEIILKKRAFALNLIGETYLAEVQKAQKSGANNTDLPSHLTDLFKQDENKPEKTSTNGGNSQLGNQ